MPRPGGIAHLSECEAEIAAGFETLLTTLKPSLTTLPFSWVKDHSPDCLENLGASLCKVQPARLRDLRIEDSFFQGGVP